MAERTEFDSPLVDKLSGVHLFGFDGAPCSQRVGFALAEKGLKRQQKVGFRDQSAGALAAREGHYVMRQVSLIKHDNMTPEYAAIQPNMVIPALVDNGHLWIESMDIITHLDETRPGPKLLPEDSNTRELCDALVQQGKDLHIAIRHITFNWSLGKLGKTDDKWQAQLARQQPDDSPEKLAEFYARFNKNDISDAEYLEHLRALEQAYAEQEQRLNSDKRQYLTGDTFSMADIIWSIKVLRLVECGYPLARNYPALNAWYQRVSARPGFREGVIGHNRFFHHAFRIKAGIENFFGRGMQHSSKTAATAAS